MERNIPRLLIGGTHSGCGKTTVVSAVLRALVLRGDAPAAFKCGPDFIDPMFHRAALGVSSRNLDLFLCGGDTVRALLAENTENAAVAVIEGAMGFYDGVGGSTDEASACDLARQTDTPAVLVVQARGASLSLAAMLRGFLEFAPNTLKGVILNGVSPAMYGFYRDIIEKHTPLRVYGHLPMDRACALPSRHLGLVTADEIEDLQMRLDRLAAHAEACIDLNGLADLACSAPPLSYALAVHPRVCQAPVRIGIARDRAFCFYYEDGLDVLRACGAELVPFSPLSDAALPENLHGLYLGGGYPELHGAALTANEAMRNAVRRAVKSGVPTLAECGGFLYLHESLTDAQGNTYPMAGAIAGGARLTARLQNFGYVTLTAKHDTMLLPKGASVPAHEFHYTVSDDGGSALTAQKPQSSKTWQCVYSTDSLFAGYPHLHFAGCPALAAAFVRRCASYRKEQNT